MYRLIFGSELESALAFQDWVFEEVLPSIRKTGKYAPTREQLKLELLEESKICYNLFWRSCQKYSKIQQVDVLTLWVYYTLSYQSRDLGFSLSKIYE